MQRKAALATAGALTATLFSGVVAVGATTGLLSAVDPGGPGHARLVGAASSARAKKILMIVDDPAPAATGSSARPSRASRTTWAPTSPSAAGTSWGTSAGTPTSRAARPPSPPKQSTTTTEPEEVEEPKPTTTTTRPTGPFSCRGSDDGMTEAQKKALEAWREGNCQGGGGDD